VLVEADDMDEPVADALRSLLDGHVVLSRKLATQGHYPAIDVIESLSRLMPDVTGRTPKSRRPFAGGLATHREAEDLIRVGAYVRGTDAKVDYAVDHLDRVNGFSPPRSGAGSSFDQTERQLMALFAEAPRP
jgi:flagellum-specific ATP synthase